MFKLEDVSVSCVAEHYELSLVVEGLDVVVAALLDPQNLLLTLLAKQFDGSLVT